MLRIPVHAVWRQAHLPQGLRRIECVCLPAGLFAHPVLQQGVDEIDRRSHRAGLASQFLENEFPIVDHELQVQAADRPACLTGTRSISDHRTLLVPEPRVGRFDQFCNQLAAADLLRESIYENGVTLHLAEIHGRCEVP